MSSGKLTQWKNTAISWFFGIGINKYEAFSDLSNAVRDVEAIAKLVNEEYDVLPEHVITLFNEKATEENIIQRLDWLSTRIKKDDKLIIYYSGHGKVNHEINRGYWLPHDAKKESSSRYIPNSTIQDYIGGIDAKHILLISDACFAGSIFMRGEYRSGEASDELESRKSRWALCSGRADEKVYDGEIGGHSPFAQSLLNILSSTKKDSIAIGSIVNHVIEETASNYEQLPDGRPMFGVGHGGGQYIFRKKGSTPIQRASETDATNENINHEPYDRTTLPKNNLWKRLGILTLSGLVIATIGLMIYGAIGEEKGEGNVVKDIDDTTYPYKRIGNTLWTTLNMDYVSEHDTDWAFLNNDAVAGKRRLGLLYTYQGAVEACSKLAGHNWTLPALSDWKALADSLGSPLVHKGGKKYIGQEKLSRQLMSSDIVGFNMQLGGYYIIDNDKFSHESFTSLTVGIYWLQDKLKLRIEEHDEGYTMDIAPVSSWNHAYSCRCIKRLN